MKYFTIAELSRSSTATQYGIDNTPTKSAVTKLTALVENILDPLRAAYGKPITITSGYRCAKLNKLVGGVNNSQHLSGEAADINVGSPADNRKLAQLIIDLKLPYDQLINESDYAWVHVSYSTRNRRQFLKL